MPPYRKALLILLLCMLAGAVQTSGQSSRSSILLRSAREHHARAKLHLAAGDQEKALTELKLAIDSMPEFVEAHRDYQDIRRSKTDALFAEYRAFVNKDPKSAAFRFLLGRVYTIAGRRNEAEVEYQKALEIDPGFSWALLSMGLIERDRTDTKRAADYLQKARAKAGAGAALHYSLAS